MTKHEFVEYVKTNKKKIALGALCAIGTGVLIAFNVKDAKFIKMVGGTAETIHKKFSGNAVEFVGNILADNDWCNVNVVEGFTTGKVNHFWNEGDYGNAIVQFFKVKDMGTLGADLKKLKGITDDTVVSAVFAFADTMLET